MSSFAETRAIIAANKLSAQLSFTNFLLALIFLVLIIK